MELLLSMHLGCAALVLPTLSYYGGAAGVLALGIVARGPACAARIRHLTTLWDARSAWLRADAAHRPPARLAYDTAIAAAASDRAFPLRDVARACQIDLAELEGLLVQLSVARPANALDTLWQRCSPNAVQRRTLVPTPTGMAPPVGAAAAGSPLSA